MIHESEVRERKTYTFRNEDSAPRSVIVEHPVRAGYALRSKTHPVENSRCERFSRRRELSQVESLTAKEET